MCIRDRPYTRSKSFSNFLGAFIVFVLAGYGYVPFASAQAITIDTTGRAATNPGSAGTVDRRYRQVEPTNIPLPSTQLDPKARLELLRFLQSDQGLSLIHI